MTNEQFIKHSLAMRESPAWRHLPDHARRVLDRIEVEHLRKGGGANGNLIVTYDKLEAAGLRRKSIALAIRQCVALGFLVVAEKGGWAPAHQWSSRYRLTYAAPKKGKPPTPTDDWKQITTDEMAAVIVAKIDQPVNGKGRIKEPSAAGQSSPLRGENATKGLRGENATKA